MMVVFIKTTSGILIDMINGIYNKPSDYYLVTFQENFVFDLMCVAEYS